MAGTFLRCRGRIGVRHLNQGPGGNFPSGWEELSTSGRIDRIDRSAEHEYEVWDYKTGSSYGYKEEGYLDRGRQLQHALYAEAAEIILKRDRDKKAKVVRSGYFFPGAKGEGSESCGSRIRRKRQSCMRSSTTCSNCSEMVFFPYSPVKDPVVSVILRRSAAGRRQPFPGAPTSLRVTPRWIL